MSTLTTNRRKEAFESMTRELYQFNSLLGCALCGTIGKLHFEETEGHPYFTSHEEYQEWLLIKYGKQGLVGDDL
jgi:hypothetical protein